MRRYKRPPITEAVIEIRYEKPVAQDIVEKLHARFRGDYAFSEKLESVSFQIDTVLRAAQVREEPAGYKLASEDQADVLQVTPIAMICSRLAPYTGWESLFDRAQQTWSSWRRIAGYNTIGRLGIRYVNRIDIPVLAGGTLKPNEYLSIYPEVPDFEKPLMLTNYTMQVVGPLGSDECDLLINTNLVPSPLINHMSIILDVDISRMGKIPQRDEDLWSLVAAIRDHKNRIFEGCVTDRARALFDT